MMLIFKKFYCVMQYRINVEFIGVSDLCKMLLNKSCSPLNGEQRDVCGLGKSLLREALNISV